MPTVRKTLRIDAVNRILSSIGEQPINSIQEPVASDVAAALLVLDEIDLDTQSQGWHFNTEFDVQFTRDVDGFIAFPSNAIQVFVSKNEYPSIDVSFAKDGAGNLLLYDVKNHTFVFAINPKATVVYLKDFEETPEPFRRYVAIRAARMFRDRYSGNSGVPSQASIDELRAKVTLEQSQGISGPTSIFDSPAAARVVNRPYPRVYNQF